MKPKLTEKVLRGLQAIRSGTGQGDDVATACEWLDKMTRHRNQLGKIRRTQRTTKRLEGRN